MNLEQEIRKAKRHYRMFTLDIEKLGSDVTRTLVGEKPEIRRRSRKTLFALGMVITVASGTFATAFASPAADRFMHQIPAIGSLLDLLQSSYAPRGIQSADRKFDIQVNKRVSDHGITISIDHAYCDEDQFAFQMTESILPSAVQAVRIDPSDIQVDIDGTRKLYNLDRGEFIQVGSHQYSGIVHFLVSNDTPYVTLPMRFTVNVHIHRIGSIEANWNLSFPLSRTGTATASRVYYPEASGVLHGITLTVKSVIVEPSMTKINYELRQPTGIEGSTIPHLKNVAVYDASGTRLNGTVDLISKAVMVGTENVIELTAQYTTPNPMPEVLIIKPDAGLNGLSIKVRLG